MNETLDNAKEELKRIDHLIYVTLKYTRTVDVLLSVVERMINAYEFLVEVLIKKAVQEESIELPDNPIAKAKIAMRIYDSASIKKNIEKYLLFRKLRRMNYDKINEFRRHVALLTEVDEVKIEVNIDSITEDFHTLKAFFEKVEKLIQ